MIRHLALLLLLVAPAAAQAPRCGFGLGLGALVAADGHLRAGLAASDLLAGRDAAAAASLALAEATGRFAGCGCARAAAEAREAQGLAEQAGSEVSPQGVGRVLDRARFSLGRARERLDRQGCG